MSIPLLKLEIVFCPFCLKWVDVSGCHFCNCRVYSDDFRCDVDNTGFPSNDCRPGKLRSDRGWTTKRIISEIQEEDARVRKLGAEKTRKQEVKERILKEKAAKKGKKP